jgi:NarL family two-component system sensor histidine kinase LiaS
MIEDDGIGYNINSSTENPGMGIRSMKTRIDTLSGDIEFNSAPGKGMSILFELPISSNIKTQE